MQEKSQSVFFFFLFYKGTFPGVSWGYFMTEFVDWNRLWDFEDFPLK